MVSSDLRHYRARRCTSATCGLRFPVEDGSALGATCPHCGAQTEFVDGTYQTAGARSATEPTNLRLSLLLDNIRSLRNVGGIFRTCDGAAIDHVYVGGITATPDHPKIAKTALGAEKTVSWTRFADAAAGAAQLASQGKRLWAIEGGPETTSLFAPEIQRDRGNELVIVFGHEVSGIDPRILDVCERVVHIPMLGTKGSLNVSVALGIVAYTLRFG